MVNKTYLGNKIIIKEKIEAPIILVENKGDGELIFYKKHNRKITLFDKVLTQIYDEPIKFLIKKKDLIKKGFIYKFHYLYDVKPVSITYNTSEQFILTEVIKKDNNAFFNDGNFYNQNTIFADYLTEDILNILNLIETDSFSTFIDAINIEYKSCLGNTNANAIDVFVINADGTNRVLKKFSHNFQKDKRQRVSNDKNALIIKEVINFVSKIDFNNFYYEKTNSYNRNYINLIFSIYELFEKKIGNVSLEKSSFMNHSIFSLNKKYLVGKHISNDDLFKLLFNIFNKEKKFNNFLLSTSDFKKYKKSIYSIRTELNKNKLIEKKPIKSILTESTNEFITFNDFLNKKNNK